MPFGLGVGEIVLIVFLLVLMFGSRKIPLIARGVGESIRNFKREIKSGSEEDESRELPEDGDGNRS